MSSEEGEGLAFAAGGGIREKKTCAIRCDVGKNEVGWGKEGSERWRRYALGATEISVGTPMSTNVAQTFDAEISCVWQLLNNQPVEKADGVVSGQFGSRY